MGDPITAQLRARANVLATLAGGAAGQTASVSIVQLEMREHATLLRQAAAALDAALAERDRIEAARRESFTNLAAVRAAEAERDVLREELESIYAHGYPDTGGIVPDRVRLIAMMDARDVAAAERDALRAELATERESTGRTAHKLADALIQKALAEARAERAEAFIAEDARTQELWAAVDALTPERRAEMERKSQEWRDRKRAEPERARREAIEECIALFDEGARRFGVVSRSETFRQSRDAARWAAGELRALLAPEAQRPEEP